MHEEDCEICGKKALRLPFKHSPTGEAVKFREIECQTCGKYKKSSDFKIIDDSNNTNFYKVSSWIREKNDSFGEIPEINKEKFEQVLHLKDKKIKEKFDLMMHYFSSLSNKTWLDEKILVKCWIRNIDELDLLIKKGLLDKLYDVQESSTISGEKQYPLFNNLTFDGLEYIENLEEANKNSKNIFVAFNFTDELIEVFEKEVKEAIEDTGFTYTIVNQDTTAHDQKISDEIVAKIKSSRMIIADFTNNSTNVYFEAGLAMGLRIPVIWTCQEGHEFSFDTGQFPHITWKNAENLKLQVINRINAIK